MQFHPHASELNTYLVKLVECDYGPDIPPVSIPLKDGTVYKFGWSRKHGTVVAQCDSWNHDLNEFDHPNLRFTLESILKNVNGKYGEFPEKHYLLGGVLEGSRVEQVL